MKKKELTNLGLTTQELRQAALSIVAKLEQSGYSKRDISSAIKQVCADPLKFREDPIFQELVQQLLPNQRDQFKPRSDVPCTLWGSDFDAETLEQMKNACSLPIAQAGALMPDAHLGYGLPVGGVLATTEAVIPYAVGVDIGCRVKLSIMDLPLVRLGQNPTKFKHAIENNTAFGIGSRWKERKDHPVLQRNWHFNKALGDLHDLAWGQLGTSGSGNHFVEFGELELTAPLMQLTPGKYLALVSHSGSRGPGARVANFYTQLARSHHPSLPAKLKHLAWLDLKSPEGQEYWEAMNLMGDYASANHEIIHRDVLKAIGARALCSVENHHNFAWQEEWQGQPVIMHRKGATPAHKGTLGYIPGTMVHPGYLVRGQGQAAALNSCSHGAGRAMSRKQAKNTTTRNALRYTLQQHGVTLLSCGLDESPHAYKSISSVMHAQQELVEILGAFQPRIVKMAPEGEKPED